MGVIGLICLVFLLVVLWHKVGKFYYKYWYYTSQGVSPIGFPMPLLGTSLTFLRDGVKNEGEFTENPFGRMYRVKFGEKLPPYILSQNISRGLLSINCPLAVNELYTSKNKYFDKSDRF